MPGQQQQQLWEVVNPKTGKSEQIPFDHEPTDAELDQHFATAAGGVPPAPVGASQFVHTNPSKIGITRDLTTMEKVRQNLPMIGGITGGLAAMGTGMLPAAALAGLTAAGAKGLQDLWRYRDQLPTPPTEGDALMSAGTEGLTKGVIPEVTGRAFSGITGLFGDTVSRLGAEGRNAKAFESAANPKALKVSRTGGEVGQQVQATTKIAKENAEAPLSSQYDTLLNGKFGQSREVVRDPVTGRMGKGDSIAQMHQDRSDLLGPGITAQERTTAMAPRTRGAAVKAANDKLDQIARTAKQHGMDADEYIDLSNKWRDVQEQYANPMQRQLQSKAGGNVIDQLMRPNSWKSFIKQGGTAKLDQQQLATRFMSTLDPAMQDKVKAAITKRILNDEASVDGKIVPTKLLAALDRMDKYGVSDKMVNNSSALRAYAKVLQKYGDAPEIPGIVKGAGFINKLLDRGLGDPDVQRMAARMADKRGAGQKIAEAFGLFGSEYPQYQDTETIPEPPTR